MYTIKRYGLALALVLLVGVSCNQQSDGGVYRSLDSGETWDQMVLVSSTEKRTQTISNVDVISMVFHPVDPNIIYLGTKNDGLYITLTGGERWIHSTDIDTGYIGAIAPDPVDPKNIYLGQNNTILKSTDEGLTWETIYSDVNGANIKALAVDSFEHSRVYAGTSAGAIYKSTDYGAHWDLRFEAGVDVKRLLVVEHDTRIIYVLTSDGDLYRSVTAGEPVDTGDADTINSGWGDFLTDDFKKQFDNASDVHDIALDPNDSSTIFLVTRRGIIKGINDGASWQDVLTLFGSDDKQNDNIRNVWTAPGKTNELYFTANNVLHKSVDGGDTWTAIKNFPSGRKIYRLLIDPQTPNVIYAGMFQVEEQSGLIKQPN